VADGGVPCGLIGEIAEEQLRALLRWRNALAIGVEGDSNP
jgi:hypothetical protein